MKISEISATRQFGRKITGHAAMVLPFTEKGEIAEDAFAFCLQETAAADLVPAVNMDTGYVDLLSADEKIRIMNLTRSVLGARPFVAGASIHQKEGELATLYRKEIDIIMQNGGTPILFQTGRLRGAPAALIAEVYARAVTGIDTAYAFELSPAFAPNGVLWSSDVIRRLMEIPAIKGLKHSSLDRLLELDRLSLRDENRPEFDILTGNDLAIDMIEFGSNYLLGLACFCPAQFAQRDHLWQNGDPAYYSLSDSLQHLGNVSFRPPCLPTNTPQQFF